MLLLAAFAYATHVPTFDLDPLYTKGPISGLESLAVDPAAVLPTLTPFAGTAPPKAEQRRTEATDHALQFTNPVNTWAELRVNGTKIGTIGPYATVRIDGLTPGGYWLTLVLPSGYQREFVVRTD